MHRFRQAQLARIRRRTEWVKNTLERLRKSGGKEMERGRPQKQAVAIALNTARKARKIAR